MRWSQHSDWEHSIFNFLSLYAYLLVSMKFLKSALVRSRHACTYCIFLKKLRPSNDLSHNTYIRSSEIFFITLFLKNFRVATSKFYSATARWWFVTVIFWVAARLVSSFELFSSQLKNESVSEFLLSNFCTIIGTFIWSIWRWGRYTLKSLKLIWIHFEHRLRRSRT